MNKKVLDKDFFVEGNHEVYVVYFRSKIKKVIKKEVVNFNTILADLNFENGQNVSNKVNDFVENQNYLVGARIKI